MGVKTVKEARKLPKISLEDFFRQPISPIGVDGDDIVLFIDSDGRTMKTVETINGTVKMVWP